MHGRGSEVTDALIVWRRGKVTDEANPHAARPLSLERSRRAPLSSKFLQSAFFSPDRQGPFWREGEERERWRRGRSEPRLRSPGPLLAPALCNVPPAVTTAL